MKLKNKGQYASNAAAFIAVLTVLIILYILFLPPDIRTELLGDKSAIISNGSSSSDASVLLQQNVGLVTFINTDEKTYTLPATRIDAVTAGSILKSIPSAAVSHATFDSGNSQYEIDFNVNKAATKNVLLSFTVKDHQGPLIITLNGKEIFNAEITSTNPKPIILDADYLSDSNKLVLMTTSPGWSFWSVNKYDIENLQITGDVTDYTNSQAAQYFTVSSAEKDNLDAVQLYFYPNCDFNNVGPLRIDLNQKTIYNSIADCGTRTFATLDKNSIQVGSNSLTFSSNKGSYTLDNMYVDLKMKTPTYRTYYFDLKDDYFNAKSATAQCGDSDGICPAGCSETVDPDCCFSRSGYWCALPTLNVNDRCMFYLSADTCNICKTGYYDSSGNAPTNCENLAGDSNDGLCPSNTLQPARYYDKDCCFADNPDNFWCKEVPITGLSDKCKANIDPSECSLCPSGYVNKDGSSPSSCNSASLNIQDQSYLLSDIYELKIIVRFTDDTTRKRVDININGKTFRIDTPDVEYSKVINDYARRGTNSIEIIPVDDDINIAELRVEFRQVK